MHASLERRLVLVQGAPALESYSSYLRAMYGFIAPLEAGFRQLPDELCADLSLSRRCKAGLILRDLEALSPRLGHALGNAPRCDALPSQGTVPRALGALYVLEGSTLGARWLLRHLAPLGIDDCSAYLSSYGEELGAMWQKMRAVLSNYSQQHPDRDAELVSAALQTFERLDDWFVRCGAAEVSRAA
ncbi:MAG: bacteriophytochrome heme oxygenase BphO [Polyangiaceae bacterium]|nr:bacteriophytochrome heme oxygenase BphO [Polyangiaceae bacterium]